MSLMWPDHMLTLDEWEALPESNDLRLELAEGMLVVAPEPLPWHQKAAMRLGYRLDEQLPAEITSVAGAEVIVAQQPLTIRVPDVLLSYVLVDGSSELSGEHTGAAALTVAGHPGTVDLAALTPR